MFDNTPAQEAETKPDVFSLESLIAWLEKQSGGTVYCYTDHGDCLAARYFRAHGIPYVIACSVRDPGADIEDIAQGDPFEMSSRTYAAALTRARKLLPERAAQSRASQSETDRALRYGEMLRELVK